MATSIVGSLVLYPVVNKWSKAKGKRLPLVIGCIVFAIAEFTICFVDIFPKDHKMATAIVFALFVSFPFAVLNILPGSMMADVIQYDTIISGVNQEGTFAAAKSFVTKMGTSIATMMVPSLIAIGAVSGENVTKTGLMAAAVAGGVFCIVAIVVFCFYKEKEVLTAIKNAKKGE